MDNFQTGTNDTSGVMPTSDSGQPQSLESAFAYMGEPSTANTPPAAPAPGDQAAPAASETTPQLSGQPGQSAQPAAAAQPTDAPAPALDPNAPAPAAQPGPPQTVPYETLQATRTQMQEIQARAERAETAAELGIPLDQYQAWEQAARAAEFPDVRSYYAYAVAAQESTEQQNRINQRFNTGELSAEDRDRLIRAEQTQLQTVAQQQRIDAQLAEQSRIQVQEATRYANTTLGVEIPPDTMLGRIFAATEAPMIRAFVDGFKPLIDQAVQRGVQAEMAKINQRQQVRPPVSANAGGSPGAQAAYDPAHPPSLASLMKI